MNIVKKDDLCKTTYFSLIESIKADGYSFCTYTENVDVGNRVCILRHDVDFDMYSALELAKYDFSLGVKSTFFLQLNSCYYNLLSVETQRIVYKINKLGHYLGTHVYLDQPIYSQSEVNFLTEQTKKQIEYFSHLFPDINLVPAFSFHVPKVDILGKIQIDGYENTYSDKYFRDILYSSDSGGLWRYGLPMDNPKYGQLSLQLLIHPVWWINQGVTPIDKIRNAFQCASERKIRDIVGGTSAYKLL